MQLSHDDVIILHVSRMHSGKLKATKLLVELSCVFAVYSALAMTWSSCWCYGLRTKTRPLCDKMLARFFATMASYHRCCQRGGWWLLTTDSDDRSLLTTIDNTRGVTTIVFCWNSCCVMPSWTARGRLCLYYKPEYLSRGGVWGVCEFWIRQQKSAMPTSV